jgi:hypothetical protein
VMPPLIFVHIEKTGGMSFGAMIRRQFRPDAVINVDGTVTEAAEKLAALPAAQRAKVQFIYGHMPFGLHACLPGGARYVTMLRNPIDRIASAYYYALRRPEWRVRDEIIGRRMSLRDFAGDRAAAAFNNGQTRALSGCGERDSLAGALERAVENLCRHFTMAGLLERFDESALLCGALLGWRHVFYPRKNVNRHRIPLHDIARDTIAAIERHNTLDLELYEIARKRFDEQLTQCPGVKRGLHSFRQVNRIYSAIRFGIELASNPSNTARAAIRRIRN